MSQVETAEFKKCIIVLAGPPLVGKSTLGQELSSRSNFLYLDIDAARREIFKPWKQLNKNEQDEFSVGEVDFDAEQILNDFVLPQPWETFAMMISYQKNHELAKNLLSQNHPLILGATYSRESYHDMLKILSQQTQSSLRVFLIQTSDAEIEKRITERLKSGTLSNVRSMEHYLETKNRYQEISSVDLTRINTGLSVSENVQQIMDRLKDLRVS